MKREALSSSLRSRLERTVIEARRVAEEGAAGRDAAYETWLRMFSARLLADSGLPVRPHVQAPVRLAPECFDSLKRLLADLPAEIFTSGESLGWSHQFWQAKRKSEVNESGRKIGAGDLPAVTQLFTEDYMVKFLLDNTLGAWWAGRKLNTEETEEAEKEEELRKSVALPGIDWQYLRFVRQEPAARQETFGSSSVPSVPSVLKSSWRPAAGTFPEWPHRAAELKVLDPCCGSGHFLVAAFDLLVRMRMAEESLDPAEACDAVLRDNLFGLEIDRRCAQIAAFALALAAWTFPGAEGCRRLPPLGVAWSGSPPAATKGDWIKVADGHQGLQDGMACLWSHFRNAATLGSLIDPRKIVVASPVGCRYEQLRPLVSKAASMELASGGKSSLADGVAAAGFERAAELLADRYHLVITNVPYLKRGKQNELLKQFSARFFPDSKADLASTFVQRCLEACGPGGVAALVTTQYWLFLRSYRKLRERVLRHCRWPMLMRLGTGAFETIGGEVVNVALSILSNAPPADDQRMVGADLSRTAAAPAKAERLRSGDLVAVPQKDQLGNPEARVTFGRPAAANLLCDYATVTTGLQTGDNPRYVRQFWELPRVDNGWEVQQRTVTASTPFGGRGQIVFWERGKGALAAEPQAVFRGLAVRGRRGVAVTRMTRLAATLYTGELIDQNAAVIVPLDESLLPAIWAYCRSGRLCEDVRRLDQKFNVTPATLGKVPFDVEHWRRVAAVECPHGVPKPSSNDPTQWIFHGRPERSERPLQVAVARLLGYRWPGELDGAMRLSPRARRLLDCCKELPPLADQEGIVCLPAVAPERSTADRLRAILAAAYGRRWSPARESKLLESAGFAGKTLDDWLRDAFFDEHCRLFGRRPFIWHIWDGRPADGFAALVNYHKLDHQLLEKLIHDHLGDWIERQEAAARAGRPGAEARRRAACELRNKLAWILEGEAPYDVFVRWKPIDRQPIGWEPDLNDGVRLNIRPFVAADVLRKNPRVHWKKDRGKAAAFSPWYALFQGDRVNDHHLTLAEKTAARGT